MPTAAAAAVDAATAAVDAATAAVAASKVSALPLRRAVAAALSGAHTAPLPLRAFVARQRFGGVFGFSLGFSKVGGKNDFPEWSNSSPEFRLVIVESANPVGRHTSAPATLPTTARPPPPSPSSPPWSLPSPHL